MSYSRCWNRPWSPLQSCPPRPPSCCPRCWPRPLRPWFVLRLAMTPLLSLLKVWGVKGCKTRSSVSGPSCGANGPNGKRRREKVSPAPPTSLPAEIKLRGDATHARADLVHHMAHAFDAAGVAAGPPCLARGRRPAGQRDDAVRGDH